MSEVKWYAMQWLKVRWLVYIVAFFLPPFGWVTFWVFSGREPELKVIARGSMIASFVGVILLILAFIINSILTYIQMRDST